MKRKISTCRVAGLAVVLCIAAQFPLAAEQTPVIPGGNSFLNERLRNPFWPVGYFPESWSRDGDEPATASQEDTSWDGPAALLRVSGTSRMGSRMVAIVNEQIKNVGELVEIEYGGRVYQWKVQEIRPDGTVNLERHAVKAEAAGTQAKGMR